MALSKKHADLKNEVAFRLEALPDVESQIAQQVSGYSIALVK